MAASPASLSGDDLICAHLTLGGLERPVPLEQRAAAAAAGGFRWIGWLGDAYVQERQAGRSDADITAILDDYGVGIAEVEFLYGWASTGETPAGSPEMMLAPAAWQEQEARLFHIAGLVGARHINCGDVGFNGPLLPLEEVAERFAGICDRAAEHGLKVGIEFLPWTDIPDATTAWDIARLAGRTNGGVLVDAWHYFRGAADPDALLRIPAEHIVLIQLDDAGPAQGPAWEDTSLRRLPPGEGELDLVGFLQLLDGHGVRAPISVEVMSEELAAQPLEAVARRVHDAAAAVVAKARS